MTEKQIDRVKAGMVLQHWPRGEGLEALSLWTVRRVVRAGNGHRVVLVQKMISRGAVMDFSDRALRECPLRFLVCGGSGIRAVLRLPRSELGRACWSVL